MRQQGLDLARPLSRQSCQHVLEVGIRIVSIHARGLNQAHDRRRTLATAQRPGKQPIGTSKCPRSYLVVG